MSSSMFGVAFDARDAQAAASFWAAVLGRTGETHVPVVATTDGDTEACRRRPCPYRTRALGRIANAVTVRMSDSSM